MPNFQPKDIVAILVLFIGAVAKYFFPHASIEDVIALMMGYYFGHRKSGTDSGK